jgi:hypothetical protein
MSVPPLQNTIEGGTNGNPPVGFDSLISTPVCSTDQSFGGGVLSVKYVDAAALMVCRWNAFGNLTSSVCARAFLWITSAPTGANLRAISLTDNAGNNRAAFEITTGGKAQIHTGTASTAGASNIPTSSWIRAEVRCTPGENAELRWWLSPLSTSAPDEALIATTTATEVNGCDFGSQNSFPTTPYTFYLDWPAVSAFGWIGPDAPQGAPIQVPAEFPPRHFGPF